MRTLYCDGAGWNGKTCGYAIVDEKGRVVVHNEFEKAYTNNEMEYTAVWKAVQLATSDTRIVTDSQLVVNQVNGTWAVNEGKFNRVVEEIRKFIKKKNLVLEWVPRKENLAGIFLERVKKQRKREAFV